MSDEEKWSGAPALSFLSLLQLLERGELQAAAEDLHRLLQLLHDSPGNWDIRASSHTKCRI